MAQRDALPVGSVSVESSAERIMTCLLRVLTPSTPADQTAAMRQFHAAIEQLQRERDEARAACNRCAASQRSISTRRPASWPREPRRRGDARSQLDLRDWPWA